MVNEGHRPRGPQIALRLNRAARRALDRLGMVARPGRQPRGRLQRAAGRHGVRDEQRMGGRHPPHHAWSSVQDADRALDGSSWSSVSSPNAGQGDNWLYGVAAVPNRGGFWAVGTDGSNTLTEFHC